MRHYGLAPDRDWGCAMQKDTFHQAVVGGIRFDGVLSADGPYITACSVAGNWPAGGVALVVSGLRQFLPSQFGRGPGPWGWYIVKYRSEARVLLDGFTNGHLGRMRAEFGLLPVDEHKRHGGSARAFYESRAWAGLVQWVGKHPRMAKRMSRYDAYLPGWYDHALIARGEPAL